MKQLLDALILAILIITLLLNTTIIFHNAIITTVLITINYRVSLILLELYRS